MSVFQCHYSVEKASGLLGLGSESVFKVAADLQGRMDPVELEKNITESRAQVTMATIRYILKENFSLHLQ